MSDETFNPYDLGHVARHRRGEKFNNSKPAPSDPARGAISPRLKALNDLSRAEMEEGIYERVPVADPAQGVKRYDPWCAVTVAHRGEMNVQPAGDYVLYSDYATLSADKIAAEAERDELRRLNDAQAEMIGGYIKQRFAAQDAGISLSWDGEEAIAHNERAEAAEAELERVKQERDEFKAQISTAREALEKLASPKSWKACCDGHPDWAGSDHLVARGFEKEALASLDGGKQ